MLCPNAKPEHVRYDSFVTLRLPAKLNMLLEEKARASGNCRSEHLRNIITRSLVEVE